MKQNRMRRVSKGCSCPICGKPDWCLVAIDGSAAICARIEEGSVKKCGDAGWLHILSNSARKRQRRKDYFARISIDFGKKRDFNSLAKLYQTQLTEDKLQQLSNQLNVSPGSLSKLSIGWDGRAYTFPMSNDFGKIIGIRRRFPDGTKVSIKASRTGLFIPSQRTVSEPVLICEGATDTAAALDLGFDAIGRPNCNSLIEMTAKAVKDYKEIVIIGDNDTAGKEGAEKLLNYLSVRRPRVKLIYPPVGIKDLRQWLSEGLTNAYLKQIIDKTDTVEVQIRVKD